MKELIIVLALARVIAGETPGCQTEAKLAAAHVWNNRNIANIQGGWFGDATPTAADWYAALNFRKHDDPTNGALWFIHPTDRKRMPWLQGPNAERTGAWQCNGTAVESWRLKTPR